MARESSIAVVSRLARPSEGAFRGRDAVAAGVSRKQLGLLVRAGVARRVLPDTYVLTAVAPCASQRLRAALLWAGDLAAADGRSAAQVYGLEGVHAGVPEIVLPRAVHRRTAGVIVRRTDDTASSMIRSHRGFRVTGPEATLVRLGHVLDAEPFEIACEEARRRRLTSVAALRAYLVRYGRSGRPGIVPLRDLLDELDPCIRRARCRRATATRWCSPRGTRTALSVPCAAR